MDEKGLFVLEKTGARAFSAEANAIAKRFVTARQTGDSLPMFPGALPPDLASAYACQDAAIALVPDAIAGWKVGLIGKDLAATFKQDRLAGPIFASSVREARAGEHVGFPVFRAGFAAVEMREHFDCFRGSSKEGTARKYGVVGVNVYARKTL